MVVRWSAQLVLFALLASCSADVPETSSGSAASDTAFNGRSATTQPSARLLTPDGWGPLRIGMSRAEVVAAAGEDANPEAVGGPEPDQCDEFRPSDAPDGVLVMVEKGVLTRISVSRSADITTPAGFHVGDSGASVLAEYGARARVDPHKYWEPPARYITVWRPGASGTERRGIRYEVDSEGDIVHLHAGGPSIEYVEGCL